MAEQLAELLGQLAEYLFSEQFWQRVGQFAMTVVEGLVHVTESTWVYFGCGNSFDRRRRRVNFGTITVLTASMILCLRSAHPEPTSIDAFFFCQQLAIKLFNVGLLLAFAAEFLLSGSPTTDESEIGVLAFLVLRFASIIALRMWKYSDQPMSTSYGLNCDGSFVTYTRLLAAVIDRSLNACSAFWMMSLTYATIPIEYEVRIDGQPNLRLFVWYKMNVCVRMPAVLPQVAANVVPQTLSVHSRCWPSMSTLPWWISMKLSEEAVAAG